MREKDWIDDYIKVIQNGFQDIKEEMIKGIAIVCITLLLIIVYYLTGIHIKPILFFSVLFLLFSIMFFRELIDGESKEVLINRIPYLVFLDLYIYVTLFFILVPAIRALIISRIILALLYIIGALIIVGYACFFVSVTITDELGEKCINKWYSKGPFILGFILMIASMVCCCGVAKYTYDYAVTENMLNAIKTVYSKWITDILDILQIL